MDADNRGATLMVVGDPSVSEEVQRALARSSRVPITLRHSATVPTALRELASEPVDAVLASLRTLDGYSASALHEIRERAPAVPVLVLADGGPADTARLWAEGIYDCLSPEDLRPGLLDRAVRGAFERRWRDGDTKSTFQTFEDELRRRMVALDAANAQLAQESTKRQQAETALRAVGEVTANHLAELQAILHNMAEGVIVHDADGGFLTMNPAALKIHGYGSVEEAAADLRASPPPVRLTDLQGQALPAEDWPVARATRGETFAGYEVRWENTRSERSFLGSFGGTPVRSGEGEIILTLLTLRDITEEKQLEERHRFLSAIVESSNDAIIGFNLNDEIVSWNHGAAEMFGYTAEEVLGQRAGTILQSEAQEGVHTLIFTDSISRYEALGVRKDGTRFDISVTISPIRDSSGTMTGLSAAAHNITRRKRTEQALRLSEERFRTALKGTPITVFNQDRDLRYTWVYNPFRVAAAEMIGRRDTEMPGLPDELLALEAFKRRVLESGEGLRVEVPVHAKGAIHIFDITLEPLLDENGEVVGITGASLDITRLKQIEEAERQQRLLAEALRDTAMALSSSLQLGDVLTLILENLERVVPNDAADVMLLDGDYAVVAGRRGPGEQRLGLTAERRVFLPSVPVLHKMAQSGSPQLIADVKASDEWDYPAVGTSLRSYVGVPIWWQHNIIGFLNLFSTTPGFFTAEHIQGLQALAPQAAVAIQNARQFEQAQHLAALEERQRLARDLHDAVNQSLFTASVLAESLLRLRERAPEKVWDHLETLHLTTRGALAEMRTLLIELRPEQLINASLSESLAQLVYAVRSRKRIEIALDVHEESPVEPEVKIALYRIAQEALTNIVRHAHASHVKLQFVSGSGKIELHVEDDGKGFNVNAVTAGTGLAAMRERAAAIGALLRISSTEGGGTRLSVIYAA